MAASGVASQPGDSLGMLEAVRALPEQMGAARVATRDALGAMSLPAPDDIDQVVVVGMGGSGFNGDVAAAAAAGLSPVPISVLKHPEVPAFVGPRTLVLAVSYSGGTEETLAAASACLDAGAVVVAVTAGGALADLVASRGGWLPCITGVVMPRAAIGALLVPVLGVFEHLGALRGLDAMLDATVAQLEQRRATCRPEVDGAANPAREVARRIGRTIPLVYGAGMVGAVAAMRWKCDVNENAKAPAFWNVAPELAHNEICGWGQHGDVTRQLVTLVELRHDFEPPRVAVELGHVRDLIEEALAGIVRVDARGEGRLAQLLDLVYVSEWASCYLALDNDVDPGPIAAIDALKRLLAAG